MKLMQVSIWSGELNSMELSIDADAYCQGVELMKQGKLIQDVFPQLSATEREFILSGMTPDEWSEAWGKADEATWESLGGHNR